LLARTGPIGAWGGLLRSTLLTLAQYLGWPLAWTLESLVRLSSRRVGLALVYHEVAARPGDARRELAPALCARLVESQLRHLRSRYRIVHASELLEAVKTRRRGQRFPVAVTFDDDVSSHAEIVFPMLRRLEMRATFFVGGRSLERPLDYWWQRLQRAADRGLLEVAAREIDAEGGGEAEGARRPDDLHQLHARMEALSPEQRERATARLVTIAGPDRPESGLRSAALRALAEAGHEIGFHTLCHHALPALDDRALVTAVTEGRDAVTAASGRPLRAIAYPHGRWDPRVTRAARAAGYQYGFTGQPTPIRPWSDPMAQGRYEVAAASGGHFAAQLVKALVARGDS
jgi:peptidoglycan/xylan/chitin deacetylase (PgdA/CDA1 family)